MLNFKNFFKKHDKFESISENDWAFIVNTIRLDEHDLNTSELFEKLEFDLNATELLHDKHLQLSYIYSDIEFFTKILTIIKLIKNYFDDEALDYFNNTLLWEEKLYFCRLVLGEDFDVTVEG